MRILVAGAGPGGLTAALAIAHAGHEVVVLERSPELRTAGAGIVVQTNAMRMLARLGRADAVLAAGVALEVATVEDLHGTVLAHSAMDAVRWGQPSVATARGALSETLAAPLPPRSLVFDAEVQGVRQEGSTVIAQTAAGPFEGDALVGADGIHSTVREILFGPHPPRYAGYTCWRGLAHLPDPLGPGRTAERWGPGMRFGMVPVSPEQSYWFATANAPPDGTDGPDPVAELRERFAGFAAPVDAVLAATDTVLRNDIIDIAPLPLWTEGRVTLLGDAAHAMTPNMGQGAGQSIEDAVVLGACLEDAADLEIAFARYEAWRRPRATALVRRSWRLGAIAQWRNPALRWLRDRAVRCTPQAMVMHQLADLFGVEVP